MAQMEEQIKTSEKELGDKEIANLSDAEFKTLVIRMLTEMVECSHKIKEKVKAMKSEMKETIQGTNSEGWETGTQINDLEQNEEINIQLEQNEETRIWKNEERLRIFQDNFKCSNIWIVGVPGGEKEEQEIENLFEWIMKENFPNLAKELDMQVQEAQRVPKKLDPRRNTQWHILIKLLKIKDKETILKAVRETAKVIYKGVPIKLSAGLSK